MRFIRTAFGRRIRRCIRYGSSRIAMWTARESSVHWWCCKMLLPRRKRRAHERKKNEAAGSFCLRSCNFPFRPGIGGRTVDGGERVREESVCNDGGGAEIYRGRGGPVVCPGGEGFAGR